MKTYTIGDSHADFSFRNIIKDENYRVNLGPTTMHKIRRDKSNFLELYKKHRDKDFDKDSFVIFCFGEIDVRCHINNQIVSQQKKENQIIKELALDFVNHIKEQKHIFKEVGILSITPPGSILWAAKNNEFPFIGSDFERSRYTMKMNSILKKLCRDSGIHFIDVYSKYSDSKGMLLRNLSDGGVHIGNTTYVEKKLKNILNGINSISSI